MAALLIALSAIYLMVGDLFISPLGTLSTLEQKLLIDLRLPRLLAAIAIGAGLTVSGASLQVLLGNVLAEPGVLGISGGASLAMVIVLFFLPFAPTPEIFMVAAVLGSLCFTVILLNDTIVFQFPNILVCSTIIALDIALRIHIDWSQLNELDGTSFFDIGGYFAFRRFSIFGAKGALGATSQRACA